MRSTSGEEARTEPSVALITERGGTKCALHRERRHTVPRPITFLIGEMGIPGSLSPLRLSQRPSPYLRTRARPDGAGTRAPSREHAAPRPCPASTSRR